MSERADYSTMSEDQLEAAIYDLGAQRAAIAAEMQLAHDALNDKLILASAARKVASLTSQEAAALKQYLTTQPIESGEAFGDVGG